MAKKAAKKRKKKKSSSGYAIMLIIFSAGLIVLIKHSFIFLLAGMLPTIVASIVDQSRGKMQFKTVAALNFSGIAPFMVTLMHQGHAAPAVQTMMGDTSVWLTIYGSATVGWALVWFCPWIVRFSIEFFSDNKVKGIESEQRKLKEEWGDDVGGDLA